MEDLKIFRRNVRKLISNYLETERDPRPPLKRIAKNFGTVTRITSDVEVVR